MKETTQIVITTDEVKIECNNVAAALLLAKSFRKSPHLRMAAIEALKMAGGDYSFIKKHFVNADKIVKYLEDEPPTQMYLP